MHGATELEVPLKLVESHAHPSRRERSTRDPEAPEFHRLVYRQLELLGENPDRDGLQKTPERVATSLAWLTRGYGLSAAEVVGDAVFEETHENMVLVRDIELYSLGEHHLLPFFGKAAIAYTRWKDRGPVQAPTHRGYVRPSAAGHKQRFGDCSLN